MAQTTTVTKKGQVTIPKSFRDKLGLKKGTRVSFRLSSRPDELRLKPAPDFLEVAEGLSRKLKQRLKKIISPLKAREYMEKYYQRV